MGSRKCMVIPTAARRPDGPRCCQNRSPQPPRPRLLFEYFEKPLASRASAPFEFLNYGKELMRKVHLRLLTPFRIYRDWNQSTRFLSQLRRRGVERLRSGVALHLPTTILLLPFLQQTASGLLFHLFQHELVPSFQLLLLLFFSAAPHLSLLFIPGI